MRLMVVTDGLLQPQAQWQLHPALHPWRRSLLRRRRRWFAAGAHNALSVVALMMGQPAARLLVDDAQAGRQYWVATPWHGQAVRDRVRILPFSALDWRRQDARWLQDVVQPLLDDLAMELVVQPSGAMVVRCKTPLRAAPSPYPVLERDGLGNRHPEGEDGGTLMRLLAEIQMALHQRAPSAARNGRPPVHGIWLWGGWLAEEEQGALPLPAIACRDPWLQPLCDGRDPRWVVGNAEEVAQMLAADGRLPATTVVLLGARRALLLRGRRWFALGSQTIADGEVAGGEEALWQQLCGR